MCGKAVASVSCPHQEFIGMTVGSCHEQAHVYQCSLFNEEVVEDYIGIRTTYSTFSDRITSSPRKCVDCVCPLKTIHKD